MKIGAPLLFRPAYQRLVWGGRRLERFRPDLPPGPIGEAWELADHERGMSVVAEGPLAGVTIRELTERFGTALVGPRFAGGPFPLMLKIIDAADRLSVQVHPDDDLARRLGHGERGKTECWLVLEDGGHVYQGARPGVDRAVFEAALAAGQIETALNRFALRRGDFYFVEARTVHAIDAGGLLFEIQETCDVTFRVHDWNRPGLDGKPRPLHLRESLQTIEFGQSELGPRPSPWQPAPWGQVRLLAACRAFEVREHRMAPGEATFADDQGRCAVVTCLEGACTVTTGGGETKLGELQTALVPAAAGRWTARSIVGTRLLVASPGLTPS